MSGRRRGGSGWGVTVVAAFAALGCCLLSAPTANADFDDLLDTVLGSAAAGADQLDLGGVPADLGGFDVHDVLNDPLTQLDQVLHSNPGQPAGGEPESGPADTGHDTGTDTGHDTPGGSSGNSPSLPKFSMPSGGNGGGGSGGGPGGSGGSGNGATRTKANANATKDTAVPVPAPQPEVP